MSSHTLGNCFNNPKEKASVKVIIKIVLTIRSTMDTDIITPLEVEDVDIDVNIILKTFLVIQTHFQHYLSNKLLQMFLQTCFPW